MKKISRKEHRTKKGKRYLALLLSVCLIGTMLPVTARAETGETQESGYEQEEENTPVLKNDTQGSNSEPGDNPAPSDDEPTCTCSELCTEDNINTDCPVCGADDADLDDCKGKADENDDVIDEETIIITSWQWIDEEEYLDPETGNLALPGASKEHTAYFDDVISFLPTQILATVENAEAEDTEAEDAEAGDGEENITLGDWECDNYPEEGAYQGHYTFTAALPEGYALSEEADALEVLVELGGAQTYESTGTGDFTVTGGTLGTDYTYENNVLTIKSATPITIANADPNTATNDRIEVAGGVSATIILDGVNIDVSSSTGTAAFKIADNSTENVKITLADGSENTLKSGRYCAGLQKNGNVEGIGKLTIQGGENGTGKLNAKGGMNGAGIGGGNDGSGSNIEITDGTVTATGGFEGAGIGGSGGTGSDITISGGTVTATGGINGAGIGGGSGGTGSDITISDGTVTAKGGDEGAGIGGGSKGSGSKIKIRGGTVTATGDRCGAGIGGGMYGSGSDIEISGGNVIATGASGAGIGGGYEGSGSNIEISDGTVTANGGSEGAGIGGGRSGNGSDITISGGTVTATSDCKGAGIGGGYFESGSNIKISGGTVTASGGANGAGIGGGSNGDGSYLYLAGGTVTATGGEGGAGIGGGNGGAGSNITISGGTVTASSSSGAGIGGKDGSGSDITMNGDVVLYASSFGISPTFTKGVVYQGVTVSGDDSSYTLTGGVGTVYGDPNVSGFTMPTGSKLGTDFADTGYITITVPDVDYTGEEAAPTPTVTVNKTALRKTLVQGTDYTVSVSDDNKTDVGAKQATITAVTGSGNVGEINGKVFNVKPVDLSVVKIEMTLSGIPEAGYVYDNTAKEPEPKVTLKRADGSEYTLKKDTDYTVSYLNNTSAYELLSGDEGYASGKAPTVTVTAVDNGNFTGSRSMNFKIHPADMPGFTITPYSGSYDGADHEVVSVTPVDGFSGYTVYYSTDNKATWSTTAPTITNAGTLEFYVKITKPNYKDWISEKLTATVTPVALASSMISFNDTNHYYTGQEVKPGITVKDSNRDLASGTDYTVSYTNNTSVSEGDSKAVVTITAANGNYTGSASAEFRIEYAQETYLNYCTVSGTAGNDGWYSSDVTIQNKAVAEQKPAWGALQFSDSPAGTFADSYTVSAEGRNNTTIWFKQTITGYIGSDSTTVKIDKTAPVWTENGCGISVKENWWKSLLNTISFGLFYKENVDVKVCASDSVSGVAAYYYLIDSTSGTVKTVEELEALDFTQYTGSVSGQNPSVKVTSLAPDGNYIVYAYAVDAAGNKSDYVCTNGVVLDTTAPTITNISTPDKNELTLTDQSATFTFTGSEAGTYFYMVKESSETAPASITEFAEEKAQADEKGMSVWTAKGGISYAAMTADGSNTVILTGLNADTEYTLYLAAVDQAGNSIQSIASKTFTTCKTMPRVADADMPKISGTYGQTVADMTLIDGVAKVGSNVITGTWAVTDSNKTNVPAVGTTATYQVTFTPDASYNDIYDTVIVAVKPNVSKKAITVTADDKTKIYGQANPAFTYAITEGTLVGTDTEEALGITLTCAANASSPVKAGGYRITGTSDSANYQVTVIPGVLTIEKATPTITASNYTKTYGDIKFFLEATDNSAEAGLQYAVTESKDPSGSTVENDDVVTVDARGYVTIKGAGSAKITASLPETANYNAVSKEITITVNKAPVAPNMPSSAMEVPYHCEKVSAVPLPEDWVWQEADKDKELTINTQVTATAAYDGADKGNYEEEMVSVSLTRKDISGGLWIEEISDRTYNGKAIKPEVWVYYDKQLLTAGKDYTISYKNNTNAAAANAVNDKGKSIAPTITVKGKGNYTGTATKTFTILPINLDNYKTDAQLQEILTIEPVYAKYTGKVIKTAPTVKLNGKKLALSAKQYTCEYNDGNLPNKEAYKDCGTYTITIVGSERNFKGKTDVTETISGELISKATITLDRSSYPYDRETGETFPTRVTVKYGKNILTEGTDYTVSYKDYDKTGTATVIITGMENYSGVKTKTYKITGTKLTTRMVTQINKSFPYDGTEHSVVKDTDYKIADGTTGLEEGKDYTVSYTGNRTKAGTFKVKFSGIGAYSGTVTKTFTIQKASVSTLKVTLPRESVDYTKGGVKPKTEVRFGEVLLTEGTDYTVTYRNNTKAASSEDKKAPYLYITGKGSFTGNTKASSVKFTISQAPLAAQNIVIDNVPYKNRNGNYVPAITITDSTTGRKLAKNTDYLGSFTYEIWDTAANDYVPFTGKKVEASEDNIRMRVTVSAKGSYTGTESVEYEICPKSITTVKVAKIPNQEYTGQEIKPELTITDNSVKLTEETHYTLEYSNNIKKGTASVTIRGKGQYGGSKTVKFKITSRIFK